MSCCPCGYSWDHCDPKCTADDYPDDIVDGINSMIAFDHDRCISAEEDARYDREQPPVNYDTAYNRAGDSQPAPVICDDCKIAGRTTSCLEMHIAEDRAYMTKMGLIDPITQPPREHSSLAEIVTYYTSLSVDAWIDQMSQTRFDISCDRELMGDLDE